MVTSFIKKVGVISLLSTLMSSTCNKNSTTPCPNLQTMYSFLSTAEWINEREVYNVGDTLYLFSSFPKTLNDQINTSLNIDYSNSSGIVGIIGIVLLDSIQQKFISAKDSFSFVPITGSFTDGTINQDRVKGITYSEELSQYKFHGGLICLKRGVYEIDVDNLYSAGIRGTRCTSAGFSMEITNPNKHINLFENAIGQPPTLQRQKIMYCFRVQ